MHAYYGESYIVQGVSFNVHEGEILALLGRNGAGKTSTLRSIARLDDPQVPMARSGSTTSRCTR
jgi:branched-chain amino acid transport system ATP-binding protein